MKLYSWNVNGIRAVLKKNALQEFLAEHDPDILCLQETKAQPDQIDFDLGDYKIYLNSGQRKGHFGTGVLSKIEPLNVILDFDEEVAAKYDFEDQYGHLNQEGRVTSLEFEDYYIVTSYTPNSKGDLSRLDIRTKAWDPAFKDHCQKLAEHKPVFISGDLNVAHNEIDLARPKPNVGKHGFTPEERAGMDSLLEAGFNDTFRDLYPDATDSYSWWTHWGGARERNVGWRIDYWLASDELMDRISDAQIHPEALGSDHCPVSIEIN